MYKVVVVDKAQVLRKPNGTKVGTRPFGTFVFVNSSVSGWANVRNDWFPGESDVLYMRDSDVDFVESETPPSTVAIPKPTPAGTFVLSMPDGGQVVNRDDIVWVEK